MEGRRRSRPRYSCPDLKDDVVEEVIHRCDVITAASMAGSFKAILDSTNKIITNNPRVQEQFDLPYLLHFDPARWPEDDGRLALCKLMPLDNDPWDVKMPSIQRKSWAGANGDWVVYIGNNCEWELVNVYTRHRIPLPKISDCPEVEHTDSLRTFKYDHGDCRLQKIAICRVPTRSWNYRNYYVVAIFDKLVAVLSSGPQWILLKNQFLGTHVYCDAIQYEHLVFAATTFGTVFAWDPYCFGPVNIPPPILGNFYNQGGDDDGDDDDDDGDDHEHEDEQDLPTQWCLATYFDGSPLLVCIQGTANVTEEAGSIVSHGRTLRTYANIRCRLFGMDTRLLAPQPSPWFNIDSLGEHSLFLGLNYPMMVKGDPAAVGTTLPFMRSNSIYTTDIAMAPYAGHYSNASIAPDIGRFSLDGESCVGLKIDNNWPCPQARFWFKASVSNAEDWLT